MAKTQQNADAARSPSATENSKLSSPLISACRHLLQPNGSISGDAVAQAILPNFPDLCSTLPGDYFASRPALWGVDERKSLTHARVRDFIMKELGPSLHAMGYGRGDRIGLVLPNGPELALALLGLAQWASCVPLNANGAHLELQKDLQAAHVSMIIGTMEDSVMIQDMARALNVPFCGLVKSETEVGVFRLIPTTPPGQFTSSTRLGKEEDIGEDEFCSASDPLLGGQMSPGHNTYKTSSNNVCEHSMLANKHDDEVLVLFTSGTTGNKKLVPHKLGDILIAAAVIGVSWNLSPEDVNCNLMPLFHVGGIIRQIFGPTLSGGSVICCPSFDAQLFWQLLTKQGCPGFTWYYAAPTMHQVILATKPSIMSQAPSLRMIANAAGGLLPSLAEELRMTFGANVLPSYGMTECMPISSPPFSYKLEKPGTSGVAVGPQITILSSNSQVLPPGTEGSICVRGRPCFRGYGGQSQEDTFLEGGWFNTGDLGYLDKDGYLYITGRSKEVINRGGEIISPMEVEEEVRHHPCIKDCLAFSAPHNVLQEIVGIVIVQDPNLPRIDLPSLHEFLQERLVPAKWPQCMVFMDALPKSHTNKLLRVRLGQRLNLPDMNDGMSSVERTFEATCPPQGTEVGVSIPCERVSVDMEYIQETLYDELVGIVCDSYVAGKASSPEQEGPRERHLVVEPHPSRVGGVVIHVSGIDRLVVIKKAKAVLDAYLQPSHVVSYPNKASMVELKKIPDSTDSVSSILMGDLPTISDPMIHELQKIIQDMLDLDCLPAPSTNFFHVGGSSLMASQLASKLRKKYKVSFSGADIFRYNTCQSIATRIQDQRRDETSCTKTSKQNGGPTDQPQCKRDLQNVGFPAERLFVSSTSYWSAFVQTLPGFVIFPVYTFLRFFFFFVTLLSMMNKIPGGHSLYKFIFTIVAYHFAWTVVTPLWLILLKWIVIGRYRPGRYAFWSSYYLRWWFVDVCRKIIGRGVFGSHNELLCWYYRMLGANIGSNVRISLDAEIAEYDLVTLENNSMIEYSTVRGFGSDNGAMMLGPVSVGESASVGVRSIVAPNTRVPSNSHIGPASSSYEITYNDNRHLSYNRYAIPEPSFWWQTCVCSPVMFLVNTFSHLPAIYVLYLMIATHYRYTDVTFRTPDDLMEWLCEPRRIPYYFGIRVARSVLAPLFYMGGSILVKKFLIGTFKEGDRDLTSQWQLTRHWLAAHLFSRENMQKVTELLGRHYEPVSVLYRILGAKIGKRVFWPGQQPVFSGEFDLLEIGDDVVFGSRSVIMCCTLERCEKIIFCAGANVSDNTVVLPGSIIGRNAVLASNSVCPAGRYLPESSIWLGSKGGEPVVLEPGTEENADRPIFSRDVKKFQLSMEGDGTTMRPFGRAVYLRLAPYFVWTPGMMVLLNISCEAFFSIFHSLPLLLSLHAGAVFLYGFPWTSRYYAEANTSTVELLVTLLPLFVAAHAIQVILCFVIEITAKWALLGRRREGRYNWDQSQYCQNWEFYQTVARVRRLHRVSTLDFISGTQFCTWYFKALGGKIGKDCCLYPAGGDPFMPEPDLVNIGDRCVIDVASMVTHLNTRGNFELVKITLENNVTLRSQSRLQQGVQCEPGSMLLEKSLALTGEIIEANSVWQGTPAERVFEYGRSSWYSDSNYGSINV